MLGIHWLAFHFLLNTTSFKLLKCFSNNLYIFYAEKSRIYTENQSSADSFILDYRAACIHSVRLPVSCSHRQYNCNMLLQWDRELHAKAVFQKLSIPFRIQISGASNTCYLEQPVQITPERAIWCWFSRT